MFLIYTEGACQTLNSYRLQSAECLCKRFRSRQFVSNHRETRYSIKCHELSKCLRDYSRRTNYMIMYEGNKYDNKRTVIHS